MAIEDWTPILKQKMSEVEGIVQVHNYDELPSTISAWPSLLIIPLEGRQEIGGANIALHDVQMSLYISGQILPEGYGLAVPFIKRIRDKLAANHKLEASVQHCQPPKLDQGPFYTGPGAIKYNNKEHLGIIFRIEVKETEIFTISA